MKKVVSLLTVIFIVLFIPSVVFAAEPYEFSFDLVKCDPNADGMTAAKCRNNYLNGSLDSYIVPEGGDLEPGTTVMLAVHIKLGTPKTLTALQTYFTYDATSFVPLMNSAGDNILNSNNQNNFPKYYDEDNDEYIKGWSIEANLDGQVVKLIATDLNYFMPLENDLDIAYFFFKVTDDATPGSSAGFTFDMDAASTNANDKNANLLTVSSVNSTFSIYGDQSRDASLKTLTVTNGSTSYTLDPTFTPGDSTITSYYTVVPNDITTVDLSATANNSYASVASGGLGTKSLTVGDNVFNIIVTSQFGNSETYQIHVYRLSNDATLSSLTLTNSINIGSLTSGVYEYTANNVPYATKDTTITATPTHDNAYIDSGDGTWTFTEAGTTPNIRNVVVKAENCLEEYASVPGNSCSSQTYKLTVNRIAASSNNYLSSLTVDGSSVPSFNKTTNTYNLDPVSNATATLNIGAVVEDTGKATIKSGTGTVNLNVGNNSFDVVVKAEDGSENTYTINVRRLSNDTKLLSLTVTSNPVGTFSPAFSSTFTGEYTYTYDPTVTSVSVTATVNDTNNAKVFIADTSDGSTPTGTGTLNTATNTFGVSVTKVSVVVTAEDGSVQVYPINLTRLKSSNNYLSSLSLSKGTLSPTFSATTRTYSATVDGSVESVDVYATPAVPYGQVVSITGNTNLAFGVNTIEVVVEAENGDQASYIINLTREKYDIATLDDLTVNGVTVPNFDKDTLEYTLDNIPFTTTSLEIGGTKSNSYATVTGFGQVNLNTTDNRIVVTVTAHDGVTKNEYVINVYREQNDDNTVHGITVAGIVPTIDSDGNYVVTLPNSKDTLYPADIVVSVSDDATVNKTTTLPLSTKQVNLYQFTVTSEKGIAETYNILVTRTKSNDASISKVTLTIGTDSSRYCLMENDTCTIGVPVDTTGFSLTATIQSEASISPVNGTSYTMGASESTKNVVLTVTAEDGTEKEYTVVVERQKSSNNNLKTLEVDGTSVPNFTSSNQLYNMVVAGTVEEITISAEVEDTGKASIVTDLSNKFILDFGRNQIDVTVKAENGGTKTYTIIVTRQNRVDATLKDLKINGVTVTGFSADTTEYLLNDVAYNVTSLDILAVPNDDLATKSGDGVVSLVTGLNEITILVTAHDTSVTKPYTIKVTRTENNDTGIQGITLAGNSATYNSETGNYEVTVSNDITEANSTNTIVTVNDPILTTDAKATYTVTTTPLLTKQDNIVPITVTAEDGTIKVYNLVVTRTSSNDNSISRVTLTIGSDSSRYCLMEGTTCTIGVPVDTTSFTLNAIIHSEATISPVNGTTYTMNASESTKNITLTVTAEDGTEKEYTVIVERQKSSNNNLSDLQIDGVTVTDFNANTQVYNHTVVGTTESVTISATVEDTGKATIVTDLSNNFDLAFGSNQIDITVKAENGDLKTYSLFITREKRIDPRLSDIKINGTSISDFNPDTKEYTVSSVLYNTHSINVSATPIDELGSVSGTGVTSLNTGDNTITLTAYAHDTSVYTTYTIHISRDRNSDTGVQSVSVAGVNATYNSNIEKYEVTVPNSVKIADSSNVVVTVNDPIVATDAKATYIVTATNLDTTNVNSVPFIVTAEDGTVKTYEILVTREKSNVATLESLTVTNGSFSPSFSSNNFEYTVTVPVETESFDVAAMVTAESNAQIMSGVGHYNMTASTMTVEVVVASEDASVTNTYKLNVVRTKSSVNTLSDITVSEGTLSPAFDKDTTSYTVNVGGSITSIDIGATLTDSRATILSGTGTHALAVGDNRITITVQSESGAKLDYVVNVVRAQKEDNNLTSLTVDGVSVPNFNKDTLEYTLDDVPYTKTSIDIGATLSDTDASVTGTGKKGLTTGLNTFEVKVTAQNGTEKVYKINITRTKNDNANLSLLSVNGYVLVPTFDSEIYDYEVTVGATKETLSPNEVTAIPEDTNATVEKQEAITLSTTVDNYYQVKVTAENGTTSKTYTIKVIRPKSSDATLKQVNVTGATIAPTFESNRYEYTLTVPYGSTDFTIEGIPNYSRTNVFGNGDYTTSNSVVNLTTQAEDGTTLVYKFTVVEAASNDATLSSLSVTGYPLDKTFQATTLNYSIGNIPYGTTKLKVNATANNAASTIEYYVDGVLQDSNTVNIPEVIGTKTITVKVIAADGVTIKSYNITYTVVSSSNAYLSSIVPSVGNIDFLKTTIYYEVTVANTVTSIDLDITTEDSNASITVNGESFFTPKTITINNLVVGNNPVSILVTAQDTTTTKTYNVVVKRLEPSASDDANLSSLSVENYPLDKEFNMDTLEYSIGQIPFSLTELTIHATPNMGSSSISYLVNGVRQASNVVTVPKVDGTGAITVQVTAEDGTTVKNYKITYEKAASTNAYLSNIIVSNGSLSFNKNTFAYTVNVDRTVTSIDITAITEDNKSVMQMNGTTYSSPHTLTISPLASGNTEVTILVTAENGTVLTYKVTVNKEADPASTITSVAYGHTITNGYIRTVKLGITGLEMKNQLDNPNEYLEIWSSDETTQVGDGDTLATGMIVKLMIDGVEKDRKWIVIKGDTSGDGEIDLFDAVKILNHYLVRTPLTGAYLEAAYVNDDTDIDLFDSVMILNHYLGRISLH